MWIAVATGDPPFIDINQGSIVIMAVTTERSCWGIARLTLSVFLLAIVLAYLFGGFEPAVMASR